MTSIPLAPIRRHTGTMKQIYLIAIAVCAVLWFRPLLGRAEESGSQDDWKRIPVAEVEDKIRGGILGQILGNLNGLPYEFKYVNEPGNVSNYIPSLPDGARTDDDTDLEWVVVAEIERSGDVLLPPARIVALWKKHVNRGIWCANRYARDLMDLGFEPPETGSSALNPWAEFNIGGQFACESFGLMAPAMPQTASRIGLHYTHTTIDGEPAQATQLFAAMIASAFVSDDLDRIVDAGVTSVDPESRVAEVVNQVREWHAENPKDWRATREAIKERWQIHNGSFRDQNGYELNTASTIAALLYGAGDMAESMQWAFNFGWDCDNNAATTATILGVIRGRDWINQQDWEIKDVYRNTTRDHMPTDETITSFEDRVIACADLVIREQGGKRIDEKGEAYYLIRMERPANVEPLDDNPLHTARRKKQLLARVERDLAGSPTDQARAAYLAICSGLAGGLQETQPVAWNEAVAELKKRRSVIRNLFEALPETGESLKQSARDAGLTPPSS